MKSGSERTASILYASFSGNTRRVARVAQGTLSGLGWSAELVNLRNFERGVHAIDPDLIVLGVPVQYWDIPSSARTAFVFTTFGRCVCNSVPWALAMELADKNCSVLGGAQIAAPHSARVDGGPRLGDMEEAFGKGQPDSETLLDFREALMTVASKVEEEQTRPIEIERLKALHTRGVTADLMNRISSHRMRQSFMPWVEHLDGNCEGCNGCLNACDSGAISNDSADSIVIDRDLCNRCYKCTEICSNSAMTTDWQRVVFWVRTVHLMARDTTSRFVV
jgi:ferredoxin